MQSQIQNPGLKSPSIDSNSCSLWPLHLTELASGQITRSFPMGRCSVEKALGLLLGKAGGAEVAKELQGTTALCQVLCHTHRKYQLIRPSQQHWEVSTGPRKPRANRRLFHILPSLYFEGKNSSNFTNSLFQMKCSPGGCNSPSVLFPATFELKRA